MAVQDYFSIDDILAGEPRVYSLFRVRGRTLGHLDPQSGSGQMIDPAAKENISSLSNLSSPKTEQSQRHTGRDLRLGQRVALPFWLCESLAERGIVDVELPKCFGARFRNDVRADALSVSIHRKCPYFYSLGLALAKLLLDAGLVTVLLTAFGDRCWTVVDNAAYGASAGRGADSVSKLDNRERGLFFASHGMVVAVNRWKERKSDKIACSRSVLGKRPSASSSLPESSPITPRRRII